MNALVETVQCPACQHVANFPYDYWRNKILDSPISDYRKLKEGEGQTQTAITGEYSFHIMYGRQKPRCSKCKTSIDEAKYEEYSNAGITECSNCKNRISVRNMPDSARNEFEGVKYLIGEDSDLFSSGKSSIKTPNAVKPILFTCPSCAGNLEVDGKERIITCKYCNSEIYLPDDLWLRMHPVKTVDRWYLVLDDAGLLDKLQEWYYISDVTIDKGGNLYLITAVEGDEDSIVWSFGPDLKTRWVRTELGYSKEDSGLAVSGNGVLYVYNKNKHSLLKLSAKDGLTLGKIKGEQPNEQNPDPFNMTGCDDMTVDSDGTILALIKNKIVRYTSEGKKIPTWGNSADSGSGGFFGKLSKLFSGNSSDEDSSPDVDELKNRPARVDSDYTFVNLGLDGYIYFMEKTGSEDASVAKYDRNGNKIWNIKVPFDNKSRKQYIDKSGNVYVLTKTNDKINLVRLTPSAKKWDVLLRDRLEGGLLNEVDMLVVSPDGKIYCFDYNNRLRIFDSSLNNVYISEQGKEDDEEALRERKKKIENDEQFS